MAAEVFFHPLQTPAGQEFLPVDLRSPLAGLVARLGLAGAAGHHAPWGLKVQLGARGLPPAVDPAWARAVADAVAGPGAAAADRVTFCCDTLSITTAGLDAPDTHLGLAKVQGYTQGGHGLPYLVADGADQGPPLLVDEVGQEEIAGLTLAPVLSRAAGLCVLAPVRPHPHAGFQGALFHLGVGLADRAGKIMLHSDIRPKVDTPLCAGCGSCLAVCLFDAIAINGGRAHIDHLKCTGCGECMNVCFMAGISAEEAAGVPRFQAKVAAAAAAAARAVAAGRTGRAGYFNFLVRLDRHAGGARTRARQRLGDVGVLASRDPVALDMATWDLIVAATGGPLVDWSGFGQEPGLLLERAEQLGLGRRAYRLVAS